MSDIALHNVQTVSRREWVPAQTPTTVNSGVLSREDLRPASGSESVTGEAVDPLWMSRLRARFLDLLDLGEDWDTFGSPPPSQEVLTRTFEFLSQFANYGLPVPSINGTTDGGVMVEWFTPSVEVIVEVDDMGQAAEMFFRDRNSGYCVEGPLERHFDDFSKAVYRLQVGY